MTSIWHVLLLSLLFRSCEQAVVTITGCPGPGNPMPTSITENLTPGTKLIIFKNITGFTLNGQKSHFTVANGSNSFVITSNAPYDYEQLQHQLIDVPFSCTPLTGTVVTGNLNFVVANIIENPPDFGNTNVHFNIPENSPINATVGTLHVTLKDEDQSAVVTFEISEPGTPFKVGWPPNGTPNRYLTAVISVQNSALLDYENITHYTLKVKATVRDTNLTSTATVNVSVTNIDDSPPKFIQRDGYAITLVERTYSHENIIKLVATDADGTQTQTIQYSLIRVFPPTALFRVQNTTGQVVVDGEIDREKCDNYLLLIKAYQVDKPNLRMDITTLNVTVSDADDNPPVMSETVYTVRIPENTPADVHVLTVTATDADKGANAKFHFKIKTQVSPDAFKIDASSGQISVQNGSVLDRERNATRTIVVFAESTQNSSMRSNDAHITITLLDENDNSPVFNITKYTFHVNKTLSIPGDIGTVRAADPDENKNGHVVYRLEGEESLRFNISERTGNIQAVAPLGSNYEPWYRFTVIAHDMAPIGYRRQTSAQVNVHVNDENVHEPAFVNLQRIISVPEDIDIGRDVLLLEAIDEDTSDNLTFTLGNVSAFKLNRIDNRRAMIVTNKTLNRETTPHGYNLTIKVTDSIHTSSATLSVKIEDVNDNAPTFNQSKYSFAVNEGVFPKVIGSVTAYDEDLNSNGRVSYTLLPPWNGNFSITPQTGQISVKSGLDRELLTTTSGRIQLLVMAEDKGKPPLKSTVIVTINVTDINDHAPYFKEKVKHIEVDEGKNISVQVQAYDEDEGANAHVLYGLGKNSNATAVEVQNGFLTSRTPLTYGFYEVEVIAFNPVDYSEPGLRNGTMTVFINVKDVNNHSPAFKNTPYHFFLREDFEVGNLVNQSLREIHAEDEDHSPEYNTVTYSVDNADGYFEVDLHTAALRLIKPLDFEDQHQINFQVIASDGDISHEVRADVTVTVQDVNDNNPEFSSVFYNCTVDEGVTVPINCSPTINANDDDSGENGHVHYALEGYAKSIFAINKTTAVIRPRPNLDYESGLRTYVLTIIAQDKGNPERNGTAVVEVNVKDVNDNHPVIHGPTVVTIPENIPVNTSIATLFATDADITDVLSFSLSEADNDGPFSVQSDKGLGYVVLTKHLDREVNTSYSLEIRVTDSANHSNSTVLDITVLDVNDNKPEFLEEVYNKTVDEGADSENFNIHTQAKDSDEGANAELVYSIISQDFGHHFFMNDTTGVISVLSPLNREDTSLYTLVIQAADSGDTSLSGTATVFINVDDINDCAPKFLQAAYSATVMEGSPSGTSVIHLTATDEDALPINRNVSYSIIGDSDLFGVDKEGVVALKQKVTVGTHQTPYIFQVEATDGMHNTTVNITVTVIDVNDHDPVFNETVYSFSVPENDEFADPPSVLVGVVSATDDDPGTQITYRIMSMDVPVFAISPMNGSITTNGTLDRDQCVNSKYTLTVIATDNGNATRTGFVEVTITITDVNDNWPQFMSSDYNGNVIENSPAGTEVNIHPAILVSDIDAGDNGREGIVFYLVTDSPFEIDNKTGRIFVKNASLDRETQDTYNLTVQARDQLGSGKSNYTSLIITLDDANDEPPVFIHNVSIFTFNESVPNSYLVGTIDCTDADIGGNETTRYDIDSGGEGRFYIDPIQGAIKVTGGLDREQKANYTLTIRASDGRNFATAEVEIILEDTNDNSPIFPTNPVVINVTESNTSVPRIYTFRASDADVGENSHLTYFINENDTDYSTFAVSKDGVLNTTTALDRETNSTYVFLVHVRDNGNPSLSSSVTVICHVLDSNDNSPIFYDSQDQTITQYRTSILEKSPVNSPVFFPYVKDRDLGKNSEVHFRLFGNKSDLFQCNYNTGVVTIAKRIEINSLLGGIKGYKNTTDFVDIVLAVEASDEGDPSRSTNLTLHVTVEQISDENPVFEQTMYDFVVPESTAIGSYVGVVTAVMPNVTNYYLSYSLVIPNPVLILDKSSGNITLNSTLDREESDSHTFAIQVTDGKTPERTAFTMINIHVEDVNDNAPQFQFLPYIFTVTEGNNVKLDIASISAIDIDVGRNAMINYSLLNYTGNVFGVNKTTGDLFINGTLDRETNPSHILVVQAEDMGSPPLHTTAIVKIEVEDINDNWPQFQHTNYTCSVLENASFQQICNVSATDDDFGDNGTVVYSIQEKNIPFYINPIDGTIWKSGQTDFETKNEYYLTLVAHDLGTPQRSSNVSLIITVIDVRDTAPRFTPRLYNVYTSPFTPLHDVLLNVTAGDSGVTYSIRNDSSKTFCIDHASGAISLCKALDSKNPTYVLTVLAEKDNLTDTAVIVIHMRTERAHFDISDHTAYVQENLVGGLLLDLNTTEELKGFPVHYTLISVAPEDKHKAFLVNATTGEIYCTHPLDREEAETYTLRVSAEVIRKSGRSKRSIGDSLGQVTITVTVGDVNDNPPYFAVDTKHVFEVPASLQLTEKVAELQAFDPDDTSTITYSLANADKLPFYLVSDNKTSILLKSSLQLHSYNLTVSATDEGNRSSEVNIMIITIPDADRLTYVIPMSPQDFEKQKLNLIGNLSSVLGVNISLEGYKTHVSTEVDPNKTDLQLLATNRTTGGFLSNEELSGIISAKFADIFKLFKCTNGACYIQTTSVKHSSTIMTAPEIALLTIAVLIFVACVLVIIAGNHIWKQFQEAREQEVKMWELESLRSEVGSQMAVAATNPNTETSFSTLDDRVDTSSGQAANQKGSLMYESQELRMDFDNEAFELGPPVTNGADSGVENDSSSSSNADDNEPPRTDAYPDSNSLDKGPPPEDHQEASTTASNSDTDRKISFPKQPQMTASKRKKVTLHIDMDTGDTDDGDFDLEEDTSSVNKEDAGSTNLSDKSSVGEETDQIVAQQNDQPPDTAEVAANNCNSENSTNDQHMEEPDSNIEEEMMTSF